MTPWEPRAPLERLRFVASLRAVIRAWMSAENVLEVTTPVLSRAAPADLHLDAFRTAPLPSTPTDDGPSTDGSRWLQTSPEYPMKRLLAAHGVDIHQIAPVFRAGERGARHNPEFTMLEWYRIGMDHNALMDDVAALFETLWRRFDRSWHSPERHGVHDLVNEVLGAGAAATDRGPFLDVVQVRAHFLAEGRSWPASIGDDADAALDLLLDEFVLPRLPRDRLTFLHGWPPSQAALARLGTDAAGRDVAERFEVYMGALEIGNGYHELADADEQRARFEQELARRRAGGRETPPLDEGLLGALAAGLPDCAGVAVGLDRLAMALADVTHIDELIAFPFERA